MWQNLCALARLRLLAFDRGNSGRTARMCVATGTLIAIAPEGLLVACGEGAVWLQEVQPAGRRRMPVSEWQRGRGVQPGDRFGS